MGKITLTNLKKNYPFYSEVRNEALSHGKNSCAIRLGIALQRCGIVLKGKGLRVMDENSPYLGKYIKVRSSKQLAIFLKKNWQTIGIGKPTINSPNNARSLRKLGPGILYFDKRFSNANHIDVWNSKKLFLGNKSYLKTETNIWHFPIKP